MDYSTYVSKMESKFDEWEKQLPALIHDAPEGLFLASCMLETLQLQLELEQSQGGIKPVTLKKSKLMIDSWLDMLTEINPEQRGRKTRGFRLQGVAIHIMLTRMRLKLDQLEVKPIRKRTTRKKKTQD